MVESSRGFAAKSLTMESREGKKNEGRETAKLLSLMSKDLPKSPCSLRISSLGFPYELPHSRSLNHEQLAALITQALTDREFVVAKLSSTSASQDYL